MYSRFIAVFAAVLLLAGCSSSSGTMSRERVEALVAQKISKLFVNERPAPTVHCPDALPLKAGATVTCSWTDSESRHRTAHVKVKAIEGGHAALGMDIPPIRDVAGNMARQMQDTLTRSFGHQVASVDCPSGRKYQMGQTVHCEVRVKQGWKMGLDVRLSSPHPQWRLGPMPGNLVDVGAGNPVLRGALEWNVKEQLLLSGLTGYSPDSVSCPGQLLVRTGATTSCDFALRPPNERVHRTVHVKVVSARGGKIEKISIHVPPGPTSVHD